MANVLKYLTGALSKRAKRKGNLAVGIGEENYGPSSTTGYYNGVTPPDGGFVVYATGSNSTPKVFVANSEDDLPAIARTLGGGDLDYLAAKNYIVGLNHAWIVDSIPNNTITDGLVLDLNAKNPSSFIDNLPATNVLNNDVIAGNGASLGTDAFGTYIQMPDVSTGYSYVRLPSISVSSDETYTWTFELFTTETFTQSGNKYSFDTNEYSDQYPSSNDLSRLTYTHITPSTLPANTWTKFRLTVTMKSGLTGAYTYDFMRFFHPYFQNKRVYYRNMQFERSGTATPYMGQGATRSQNTTWYDLSGNGNNATLYNSPSFSNGKLVLDNTDDYILASFDEGVLKQSNQSGTWTIETSFIYNGNSSNNEAIIAGRSGHHGGIYMYNNDILRHAVKTDQGWTGAINTAIATLQDGKGYHTVMTYNNGTVKSYLNGEYVSTSTLDLNTYDMRTYDNTFYIGGISNRYNDISLETVKCYTNELSLSDVQQNYYGGPIVTDGLVFATDAGNLVSYESDSTTTYSMTGSYSGSLNNGVAYTDSYGGGFDFDGSNDYITCDDSTKTGLNFGTGDFTLEAWFRPIDNSNSWTGVMVKGGSGGPGYAMTYRAVGSGIDLKMDIDAPDNKHYQSGYLTSGEIYHIVMVYDRDTAGFVYNNGELTHTHTDLANQNQSVDNSSFPLQLGTYNGSQWFMEGNIYAARVYNRALTSDEVLQNYNAQKARFGK